VHELYCGSGGAIWALEFLAAAGAIDKQIDFRPFVVGLTDRNLALLGQPRHGTASFLIGGAGTLLLQWKLAPRDDTATRLHACVTGKLHNPVREQLWGSPGTVLAAMDMLLTEAGEGLWRAGPLTRGVVFCHGTAGSAYALLKLFQRTGNTLWLNRARALAMHGVEQVEQERIRHGWGRHTLWSGDLGMACVLWGCITGVSAFPTLDSF